MKHVNARRILPFGMLLVSSFAVAGPDSVDADALRYAPYHGNRDQFTLELPDGWHVRDQAPTASTGVVAFFAQPVEIRLDKDPEVSRRQQEDLLRLVDDIESGAVPSFFLDRYKAGKEMRCTGFDARALKKKLKIFSTADALGPKARLVGEPQVSATAVGGCTGIRVLLRAETEYGATMDMLVYSAAVDDITYDFVLLMETDYFARNLPWFEHVIASLRLTGANRAASN